MQEVLGDGAILRTPSWSRGIFLSYSPCRSSCHCSGQSFGRKRDEVFLSIDLRSDASAEQRVAAMSPEIYPPR